MTYDELIKRINRHQPMEAEIESFWKRFNGKKVTACKECQDFYPCKTIRAIEKVLK